MLGVYILDTQRSAMIVQGCCRTGHAMKWKQYETFADYGKHPFLSIACPCPITSWHATSREG